METIGQIDILVNNAGLALGLAPYQDYEELNMLTMLDTNVKGLMAVSRRYKTVQRELSPVLGPPVQEIPGFGCVWFPEKLLFSLRITEDEQPPVVGFLLKEPLIEGR